MKTIKLIFLLSIIFILPFQLFSQSSTNELPPNFSTKMLFESTSLKKNVLSIPDVKTALYEDSLFSVYDDIPYRVGMPIETNFNTQNSGYWVNIGDSMRVWRLNIYASGAKAITLSYDKFWLPEKAKLFIYDSKKTSCLGAYTSLNNSKNKEDKIGEFANGFIPGDDIIIEYYEPIGSDAGIISINKVMYIYKDVFLDNLQTDDGRFGLSLACNININCPQGAAWQEEKRAIARIYNAATGSFCSGALINSLLYEDFFLTANHCFSGFGYDALGNNSLSQLIFYWDWESQDCTNGTDFNPPSTLGAKMVANNSHTDFALLQITGDIRNVPGYKPYYLGWTVENAPITSAVSIHHPRGDIKKIAIDNDPVMSYNSYINWSSGESSLPNTHWRTIFDVGTAEGGSSGSPLLDQNHRIVGQLHGGASGCAPVTKYYGRFDISWDYGDVPERRLKDWLGSSSHTRLDGRDGRIYIDGSRAISTGGGYFTLKNLPKSASASWQIHGAKPGHLRNQGVNNSNIVYLQNYPYSNHYDVTVEAVVNFVNSTPITVRKETSVEQLDGKLTGMVNDINPLRVTNNVYEGASTIRLDISPGMEVSPSPLNYYPIPRYSYYPEAKLLSFSIFNQNEFKPYRFIISGSGSVYDGKYFDVYVLKNNYIISPTSASDYIKLSKVIPPVHDTEEIIIQNYSSNTNIDIYIYNMNGILCKKLVSTSDETDINVSDLPIGQYVLITVDQEQRKESLKFIINR